MRLKCISDTLAPMNEKIEAVAEAIGTAIGTVEVVASDAEAQVQPVLTKVAEVVSDSSIGKGLDKQVSDLKKAVKKGVAATKKKAAKKAAAKKGAAKKTSE